ncbi:hypothetical protein CK203_105977 [Vitis vinifera]|uniref:Uncharacterized protein n=1 Tax=Vitis vinifera TaxID=29760 RepID=A0A438DR97_VITVI|nr:hypothetical protein CK203_105977 [Vitis vinifera]
MMAVSLGIFPAILSFIFTLGQSTPLLPPLNSQSPCGNQQGVNSICELQEMKLRITQLETVMEEIVQNFNEKYLYLKQREKLIEEFSHKIHHLQSVLYSIKGDSSHANERLAALEEEVRLLWAASRKNNFDLHTLESKAQDAEDRLNVVSKQVEQLADVVTEQWIQIQQLEQALQMAELRALKAKRQVSMMRCTFLKQCAVDILKNGESFTSFDILTNLVFLQFINNLFGNHLEKVFGMLDPYLFGRGSTLSSYKSRFLHQLKRMWSAAKAYHHELQGFIKQEMEKYEFTAALANDELVFFVASALITFPIMGAWMLVSSQFC